ncbi:glycine-rich domain-containing protein [Cystobacter ferrugineus]|uniref:Glycine-rich domain-containing protein-like n=1 Tax=Cystobacter ferrugineus TaxID=83449 RepID=A0A1L9B0N7_9BACT|nr:hypothetical protein [Cystobacter ferrugineus]OJH35723.1 hypothetical protein BON30_37340 [Cystobacter ferrugineus]
MKPHSAKVTTATLKGLLDESLYSGVVRHFVLTTGAEPAYVERQLLECLRYLYLLSRYPERLVGLFLPVEQAIDEVWHYLILQTREYRELCEERLPGRFFIHHRSLPYEDYQQGQPNRERMLEEALRWLPLYREEFGPFDEGALPHWTMVRFLHQRMGLSLEEIAELEAEAPSSAPPDAERAC